ncbi:Zn-ribbon domain-containing OB-fold protein [Nocardia niigatensis]|uniref:Zn-ribbon domain-containing OB-fold protein n=1 Tax=Nocardia niigatensis TaxID=209249 RepID=UPI000315DF9F|nr:OB-fold domain-containing protein [Nocardia niigatensis]
MSRPNAQYTAGVSDDSAVGVEGTLTIRRCAACDKLFAPLTSACSACASDDLEWVPSSGAGSIVSWRVVYRTRGPHGELTPLMIAIVELDEGPWVYTSLEGEVPLTYIGPVRVYFQPSPRQDGFPVFKVDADPRQPASWRVNGMLR